MLLHDARRAGRATAGRRHRAARGAGPRAVGSSADRRRPAAGRGRAAAAGPAASYAVQAAIAALHARAPSFAETDWPQIVGLYEVLLRSAVAGGRAQPCRRGVDGRRPGARARPGRCAAGPRRARGYHLLPAVRADLLRRLGRRDDAREAYLAATDATQARAAAPALCAADEGDGVTSPRPACGRSALSEHDPGEDSQLLHVFAEAAPHPNPLPARAGRGT